MRRGTASLAGPAETLKLLPVERWGQLCLKIPVVVGGEDGLTQIWHGAAEVLAGRTEGTVGSQAEAPAGPRMVNMEGLCVRLQGRRNP